MESLFNNQSFSFFKEFRSTIVCRILSNYFRHCMPRRNHHDRNHNFEMVEPFHFWDWGSEMDIQLLEI